LNRLKLLLVVSLSFLFLLTTAAGAQTALPSAGAHVTDLTNTLTADQKDFLEKQLSQFEKVKGSQVIVVIIPTTGDEAIEQYSIRLADALKVGRKGIDDGAILLIAKDDHAVRIEVGYGLEGVLTDYACKKIIESYITPSFREDDFYGGIRTGVDAIVGLIQGEQLPPPKFSKKPNVSVSGILPILFIIGFFLRTFFGRIFGGFLTGGVIFFVAWIALGTISIALLFSIISFVFVVASGNTIGRNYRGGGGFGMGGGGFSGSNNSGGFSGGGGSFGGGGASGKW
jgi:uncharacterized protein